MRGILEQGPRTHGRVGCKAHHRECEHSRWEKRLEALKEVQKFVPEGCPIAGAVGRPPAHLQARRFRSQLRGRVAGVDRRTTDRFARSNVVGETRRGREDQQHHGPCSTTVATRSRSWDDAINGDEHCELRSTYGLRGVGWRGVAPDPQCQTVAESVGGQ